MCQFMQRERDQRQQHANHARRTDRRGEQGIPSNLRMHSQAVVRLGNRWRGRARAWKRSGRNLCSPRSRRNSFLRFAAVAVDSASCDSDCLGCSLPRRIRRKTPRFSRRFHFRWVRSPLSSDQLGYGRRIQSDRWLIKIFLILVKVKNWFKAWVLSAADAWYVP